MSRSPCFSALSPSSAPCSPLRGRRSAWEAASGVMTPAEGLRSLLNAPPRRETGKGARMLDPALAAIAMIVRAVAAVVTVGIAIALAIEYIIAFTMEEITHIERRPQSESGRDATRPFDERVLVVDRQRSVSRADLERRGARSLWLEAARDPAWRRVVLL